MTHREVVDAVADEQNIPYAQARRILDSYQKVIRDALKDGDQVDVGLRLCTLYTIRTKATTRNVTMGRGARKIAVVPESTRLRVTAKPSFHTQLNT